MEGEMKMFERIKYDGDREEDSGLNCPDCGNANLHQSIVTILNRDGEDANTGLKLEVRRTAMRVNNELEFLGRRNAITIAFWCEHCGPGAGPGPGGENIKQLVIQQHKGTTYIGWEARPRKPLRKLAPMDSM